MKSLTSKDLSKYYREVSEIIQRRDQICEELKLLSCKDDLYEISKRIVDMVRIKLYEEWESENILESVENKSKIISITNDYEIKNKKLSEPCKL